MLDNKISVSEWRQKCGMIKIGKREIPIYPVYYPVGNGIFNIDKCVEDLQAIIKKNKI